MILFVMFENIIMDLSEFKASLFICSYGIVCNFHGFFSSYDGCVMYMIVITLDSDLYIHNPITIAI